MPGKILIFLCGIGAGLASFALFTRLPGHSAPPQAVSEAPPAVPTDVMQKLRKQVDDGAARNKRSAELMDNLERRDAQADEVMRKDQENQSRYSAILDTWEMQQKQYQQYLDGLRGKSL